MARNGSGTYSNPYPNFVSGTVISSSETDANNSDIATALTQSIAVDGQTTVTANLPMNSNKFTGLAVGTAATDSLSLGQAQAEAFIWCGTAGGSANAITLSPSPAITAYAAGQRFVWMASGSVNTGATTVAISGLSTIALQDNGAALVAGNHAASKMFMGILNTTSTMQIMQVQISGTDPLIISSLTVNGASQLNGTLTAGVDDTGYDVKFFGATSGAYMLWDESADDLKLVGAAGMTVAGDIDVDGTTNLDAVDIDGAVQIDGIVQVGVDGTGYDVKLFGDTSGKSLLWDQSADSLIVTGTTTLVGTTNLDAVDIDGATQIDGTVTVGVDDTGYDVKFFGATSGAHLLWDESADDLKLVGAAGMTVAGDIDVDGTTNLDAVDIDGATQIDGTVTVGVDDTGYDVKFFGATSGAYMLWDESADDLKLVGAAGMTVAGDIDVDGTTNLDAVDVDGAVNFAADVTFADGADIITASAGTSNFRAGVNAGNSIASGGNYNVAIGDEAGTAITTGDNNTLIGYAAGDAITTASHNTFVGENAGTATTANNNTGIGRHALTANTSGINVAVGYRALDANTTGTSNVALGVDALGGNVDGDQSVAIGHEALLVQDPASNADMNNVAVGYRAGYAVTTGQNNILVGAGAGDAITTGAGNVAIGNAALSTLTTLSENVAVGHSAMANATSANGNVAVGDNAGGGATNTADNNVWIGNNAGYATTSGASNVFVGYAAGDAVTTGGTNTFIGYDSGTAVTTGANNTFLGATSGDAVTTGTQNVAVGSAALTACTTSSNNTALGFLAGGAITTGASNTIIGANAGDAITTGTHNVCIGPNAGGAVVTGTYGIFIGNSAGNGPVTGAHNIVMGHTAGDAITSGANNVIIGQSAATTLTSGSANIAIGAEALYFQTSASNNTAVGNGAGKATTTGASNTAIGYNALTATTTGASNTSLGYGAGDNITTGAQIVCVGVNSKPAAVDDTYEIVIGTLNITGKGSTTAFISANGGAVYAGNNSADFSTTSDRRIKKNIVDNNIGLEKINQIQVRNFEYRTPDEIDELPKHAAIDSEGIQLGVIAQEVQGFLPQIIKEESTGCLSVDGSDIKWILVNAVQELSAEIEELKKWKEEHTCCG